MLTLWVMRFLPWIHFGTEKHSNELVKGAGYRRQTQQQINPPLVLPKFAHSGDNVVVSHGFSSFASIKRFLEYFSLVLRQILLQLSRAFTESSASLSSQKREKKSYFIGNIFVFRWLDGSETSAWKERKFDINWRFKSIFFDCWLKFVKRHMELFSFIGISFQSNV